MEEAAAEESLKMDEADALLTMEENAALNAGAEVTPRRARCAGRRAMYSMAREVVKRYRRLKSRYLIGPRILFGLMGVIHWMVGNASRNRGRK